MLPENSFFLFLSDAASYIEAAGHTLRNLCIEYWNVLKIFGKPPQQVIIRASWLQAGFYHAESLPAVKRAVCEFERTGLLVERVTNSVCVDDLSPDLMKIKTEYNCVVGLVLKMEERKYTIQEAHDGLTKLEFGDESCHIMPYI